MQILITDSSLVQTRVLHVGRWQLAFGALLLIVALLAVSGLGYHYVFVTGAREGWPLANQLIKLMVRDELAQQQRVMRENLDAIAQRVGEMQAKLVKLEALGERVTGMAGVKTDDLKELTVRVKGGQGGPFVPLGRPTAVQLNDALDQLDERADLGGDLFTLVESRLFEARLLAALVPSTAPVKGPIGSGFGFRIDPITGRPALHTGLDFPSEIGTPILAAAGGMVVVSERHPAYGNMIEIDHGNQLITRYAHASKLLVKVGTMVKRGQKIAEVGTSGRSTGPHLHFEVLLAGVQQNPARFLAGKVAAPPTTMADASAASSKARASLRRRAPAGGDPPPARSTPAPSSDLAAVGREAPSDLAAVGGVTPAPAPATPAASPSPSSTESGAPTP